MKRILIPVVSLLSIGLLASIPNPSFEQAKAEPELSIASEGDAFALLDKQYAPNESFVYTADLHFRNGQAGGLAFGAQQDDHYFVINMDRYENHVKLMYFASNGSGGYNVDELKVDYFIGNDKMTDSERTMVNPMVRNIENVNLKIILTRQDDNAYAEFFIEGIKRFGIDTTIDLNNIPGKAYSYQGGYLGMNCFAGDVYLENIEIGHTDYSYYSEPYRNQYHLSSYAKWTNDPNALCYYNGYYHVYYQTYPFGLQWGAMFWGHARSTDLIHYELLPICLFPDTEAMGFGPGDAYMWSGCAIAYYHGMSSAVDAKNWFPNGGGDGMLAIFTRDGGLQDQVIISSDDNGMTWTKRQRIPQTITGYTNKIDWRDPKVFPLERSGDVVTTWGMTLSSYALNKGWFLKSTNLLDWSIAGQFAFPTPECIGVGVLEDENHVKHAYLTNKSRTYLLGTIEYNGANVIFKDETNTDISTYTLEQMPLRELDNGPDSYASQSFYISDPASEFYGKDIVLNWFSGDLNASFCTGPGEYAGLRGRWNGGFTMPVEYGVKQLEGKYALTQKPISVGNANLEKTNIVNVMAQDINSSSENPLASVRSRTFEMVASIRTNNNSPITFKVDVGDDEYMQFGWNTTDGYYVDRTYLDDKGINTNIDWHKKYATHILGDSDVKTFYVLSDNNGLEVFCEDYAVPFYFVTTASMYSNRASLKADNAHIEKLEVNEVASIWRKNTTPEEGVLYVSTTNVDLDTTFAKAKYVTCWYSGVADLEWELLSGEDVIDYTTSNEGVNFVAKSAGQAQLKVSAGEQSQTISVTVHAGAFISDFTFSKENIVSGQWIMDGGSFVGSKDSGNAFILANETGSDFTYAGKFDILEGTAGSLVFRASSDMSSYLVANYDRGEKVVKLWSTHGELTRSGVIDVPSTNVSLTVKAVEKDVSITINGIHAIQYTLLDNEPLSGHFGLNVFSGKVAFKSLSLIKENYEYSAGELVIPLQDGQFVTAIYNVTIGNVRLEPGFYSQNGVSLLIKESYFDLLSNGRYKFNIVGSAYSFSINVDVTHTAVVYIDDITVESNVDVSVYIGNIDVLSLSVNSELVDDYSYFVKDYTLHISKDCLKEGENEVLINDSISFTINVVNKADVTIEKKTSRNWTPVIIGLVIGEEVLFLGGVAVFIVFIVKKRKRVKENEIPNN